MIMIFEYISDYVNEVSSDTKNKVIDNIYRVVIHVVWYDIGKTMFVQQPSIVIFKISIVSLFINSFREKAQCEVGCDQ